MLSLLAILLATLVSPAPKAGPPAVAGTYDTRVTLLRSNCPMTVEDNPTEVVQYSDSTTITLRHAGTTYEGTLQPDGRFSTKPKSLSFNDVTYLIGITGRFTAAAFQAEVTLRYGKCESVVGWAGTRRAS